MTTLQINSVNMFHTDWGINHTSGGLVKKWEEPLSAMNIIARVNCNYSRNVSLKMYMIPIR